MRTYKPFYLTQKVKEHEISHKMDNDPKRASKECSEIIDRPVPTAHFFHMGLLGP